MNRKLLTTVFFLICSTLTFAEQPSYPFLLFSDSDLPQIRNKVQSGWLNSAFDVMKTQADGIMSISTTPYPMTSAGTGYATAGRAINVRVNTLALTGFILEDQSYTNKAIDILLAACTQADVDDFYGFNEHLAVSDAAHAYAVGYDWLYQYMTEQQRAIVIAEIEEFAQWLYDYTGYYSAYQPTPLSCNHNSVHYGALGLCAMVLGDKSDWLDRAVTHTIGYFTYARDDTGYNYEGIGYYGYGSLGAITFAAAYNNAGLGDLVGQVQKNEYVSEYILRKIQPWGSTAIALNDSSGRLGAASGLMYKVVKYQDRVGLWGWMKLMGEQGDGYYGTDPSGYIGGGCSLPYTIIFADPQLEPLSPKDADLGLGKFFARGTGTFRSSWDDDAAMAVFTSGFDQHRGHNHRDENTYAFSAFGEYFAVDPASSLWETKSHNGILVDHTGQNRPEDKYDVYGEILDTKVFDNAWYMKGSALDAYPESLNLDRAIRKFMFVKAQSPYLVIADDIQKKFAFFGDYDWILNTATVNSFDISSNNSFTINTPSGASASVKMVSPSTGLSINEVNLAGQSIEVRGQTVYYGNFYKQLKASYYGSSPRFIAVISAAADDAQHPAITHTGDSNNMQIKVEFEQGVYDIITITRETMEFERINVNTVADINIDGSIDMLDFAVLASQWLDCSDPSNNNCRRYN